jgi:hypothetical protein
MKSKPKLSLPLFARFLALAFDALMPNLHQESLTTTAACFLYK